jgi:predicted short-subunit dehydrogenase-like oxidoreductase (DUF2520 family)
MNEKIVLIGAGSLATHLAKALIKEGNEICQVYSRTIESARELGIKIGVNYTNNPEELYTNADIYLFSVSDTAISQILKTITFEGNPLLLHTAGSISKDVFKGYSNNYGVMYPLQTFTKKRLIEFRDIPICIEANNTESLDIIKRISTGISESVYTMGIEKRVYLHLAAVFACNFTNYMYSVAEKILNQKDIPFDIIKPLIKETAAKIEDLSPAKAQTGPAVRNDKEVIFKHKELLESNPDLQKLYTFVSNSIIKQSISEKNNTDNI